MRWRRRQDGLRPFAALPLVGVLAIAGCGGGAATAQSIPGVVATAAPSSQPSDVAQVADGAARAAEHFLTDLRNGLCPAAFAMVTDPLRTQAGDASGLCRMVRTGSPFTIGSTSTLTSMSAFVGVSLVVGATPQSETLTLLYQAPRWLVSNVTTGSAVSPAGGEVSLANIVATVEQQYGASNGGATATVTCPQSGTLTATPGQRLQCSYSDSHGRSGPLTITIESTDGAFQWTIP